MEISREVHQKTKNRHTLGPCDTSVREYKAMKKSDTIKARPQSD
jgi:hypothetical protein